MEGKQASRENEQHFQDANVAEVNMVKRLLLNLRIPIIFDAPTVANEVWKTCRCKIVRLEALCCLIISNWKRLVVRIEESFAIL